MTYFWASALPVFLPAVLLLAGHWAGRPPRGPWFYVLSTIGALALGIAAGSFLPSTQVMAFSLSIVQVVLLVGLLLWQFNRSSDYFWQIVIIAMAALQWANTPSLMSLTSTHVINTDLLLNVAGIVVILALCMLLSALVCAGLHQMPWLRWPLLLVTAITMLVPVSGNILLSLMKLQVLELTGPRLTYAAKTTKFSNEVSYVLLAVVLLFALIGIVTIVRQRRRIWKAATDLISGRIALAGYRQSRTLQLTTIAIAAVMFAGQAHWDFIGSRPPQLSEATRITMTPDDLVRLPLTPLMDGKLHRFAWVADDGKVVRFFIINRLPDRIAPGVVFDACLLCGDKGYIQQGDQVVCVGCGVHLYNPSIGKPGGCNPVPIENWKAEGGEIVIPKASLELGLQLFSTVLTIEVTDPVTGRKLTNTDAPHRYSYEGKTYFFADDKAFESFRDDPEKYIRKETP